MAKPGPKGPSKPLSDRDFDHLVNLIRIQCTAEEICNVLDMSQDTLNRRIAEREIEGVNNFADLYKKYRDEGRASLRRQQWQSANAGNVTMQIWLGKQILGQKDKHETDLTNSDGSFSFHWKPAQDK